MAAAFLLHKKDGRHRRRRIGAHCGTNAESYSERICLILQVLAYIISVATTNAPTIIEKRFETACDNTRIHVVVLYSFVMGARL